MFADGRWMASVPGWTLASPVVADGFLITANMDGVVTAMRADSGELVWKASLGSTVQGTPTVARGRVFVPTVSYVLYALNLADGAMLWKRDIGGMTLSSPTPLDGDIVVAPGFPQTNLVRLSAETGAIVWQSPSVMWQFSNTAPAVAGGLVVVGSQQGHYYAFDAATGALKWEYVADGTVNLAAPLIFGGRVYMAGGDQSNRVHAVDLATGKPAAGWPIVLPTPAPDIAGTRQGGWRAVSSFAAVGGRLLLQTRLDDALGARSTGPFTYLSRETVLALDPTSGAILWQHPLARAENADVNNVPKFFVCATPAAYDTDSGAPLVAVASSLGAFVAVLDVASGNESAHYTTAGAALASPVVANGRLYTTAMTGTTEGLGSSVNHPPAAPVPAEYSAPIDLANPTLSWSSAVDRDGETAASYEVRIDADGEILTSWKELIVVDSGMTSARFNAPLIPGVTYTFAVRARDPHGALSAWSTASQFTVTGMRAGSMEGMPGGTGGAPGGLGGTTGTGGATGSTGTGGEVPRVPITLPPTSDPPANTPPGQSTNDMDGAGCSIAGGARYDSVVAIILCAAFAAGARRRKRST